MRVWCFDTDGRKGYRSVDDSTLTLLATRSDERLEHEYETANAALEKASLEVQQLVSSHPALSAEWEAICQDDAVPELSLKFNAEKSAGELSRCEWG